MKFPNRLLTLALKIREEEFIPFDMILDDFMDALGEIWREYIFLNLTAEFQSNTKEDIKERIKYLKLKLKRGWFDKENEYKM